MNIPSQSTIEGANKSSFEKQKADIPKPTYAPKSSSTLDKLGAATSTSTATPTWTVTATPTCGLAWRAVDSQRSGDLLAVEAVASNDVWAFGGGYSTPMALHWDGQQWNLVPTPIVGGGANYVLDVSALSSNDVWAVGYYYTGNFGVNQTLTLHWDGTSWNLVPSPNISFSDNQLRGVSAIASNDVWAVGDYLLNGTYTPLTLHWDGTAWNVVPSPMTGDEANFVRKVAAVSHSDVWAVGSYYSSEHGGWGNTLILHWDGTAWSRVDSPNYGNLTSELTSISALSSHDIWAVGAYRTSQFTQLLTERWDGLKWSVVPISEVGDYYAQFNEVVAIASNDVWAVGFYNTRTNLTEHWDGTEWSLVDSPTIGKYNALNAVSAVSSTDIWAVGHYADAGVVLYIHYSSNCPPSTPTPSPTITATATSTTILPTVTPTARPSSTAAFTAVMTATAITTATATPSLIGSNTPAPTSTPITYTATRGLTVTPGTPSRTSTRTVTAIATNTATSTSTSTVRGTSTTTAISTSTSTVVLTITATASMTGTETSTCIPTVGGPTPTRGATATTAATSTACTISFSDVPSDGTFYTFIRCLACRGIISGYSDGSFKPGNDITRSQITKMVSNAAGFKEDPGPQIYEDVDSTNIFYQWINRLSNRGFMGGYPCGSVPEEPCVMPGNRPYFRPFANATRGQLAKIVANATGVTGEPAGLYYADVPEDNTFYLWIMRLTNIGVMGGYPCGGPGEPCDNQQRPYFRPFANVTRGQTSKIVADTFFPDCQTPIK